MNALIEMSTLWLRRPAVDATPDQIAAWHEAKGQLHERLAATLTGREQADELAHAAAAYEHARRLVVAS